MDTKSEKHDQDTITPELAREDSINNADVKSLDNAGNREFYGDSITDSYRLKSELVGQCLEEIGMGRYVPSISLKHRSASSTLKCLAFAFLDPLC